MSRGGISRLGRPQWSQQAAGGGDLVQTQSFDVLLRNARKSGNLNLTNRQLEAIPDKVCAILDERNITADEKWWECIGLKSLNLSNNAISAVQPAIKDLVELAVLDLSYNKVTLVAPDVFSIATLKKLDLSNNLLEQIPPELGNAAALVDLNLANNRLAALPQSIGNLRALEILNLATNRLQRVPEEVGGLPLLRLHLSTNALVELPRSIGGLRRLKSLDCAHNKLKQLPDLTQLGELTFFDASDNVLSVLPFLPRTATLSEVNLAQNQLRTLDGVQMSPSIHVLIVHSNQIAEVPRDLARLPLKVLDLSNNNIDDLPGELGRVDSLNKILLDGNYLRRLKRGVINQGITELKKYLLTKLADPNELKEEFDTTPTNDPLELARRDAGASHVLKLTKWQLKAVPAIVWTSNPPLQLVELDLSDNTLTALPDDIVAQAPFLKKLNLESNQLSSLPACIGEFGLLQELNVRKNGLADVPAALARCTSLTSIDLRNNRLGAFTANVMAVGSVTRLLLGFNAIQFVPDITALPRLTELDLSNNAICEIDPAIRHTALQVLSLENNNLQQIPLELGVLRTLRTLQLNGNPQRTLRYEIVKQGVEAIQKALRTKIPLDSPLLSEAKQIEAPSLAGVDTSKRDALLASIADLENKLQDLSISKAQEYALKKKLATEKAALIKEERALQAAAGPR